MTIEICFKTRDPQGVIWSDEQQKDFELSILVLLYRGVIDEVQPEVCVEFATPGKPAINKFKLSVYEDTQVSPAYIEEKTKKIQLLLAHNPELQCFELVSIQKPTYRFKNPVLETENDRKLKQYGTHPDNVPYDFRCPLSGSVMDTPVFCSKAPRLGYFEKTHLEQWMGERREFDPKLIPGRKMFQVQYKPTDIHVGAGKKEAIRKFVETARQEAIDIGNMFVDLKIRPGSDIQTERPRYLAQALRRAALLGKQNFVELVLKQRIPVDAQDDTPEKKMAALHYALQEKHLPLATWLIATHKARVDIKNAGGITALDMLTELEEDEQKRALLTAVEETHADAYQAHTATQVPRLG